MRPHDFTGLHRMPLCQVKTMRKSYKRQRYRLCHEVNMSRMHMSEHHMEQPRFYKKNFSHLYWWNNAKIDRKPP